MQWHEWLSMMNDDYIIYVITVWWLQIVMGHVHLPPDLDAHWSILLDTIINNSIWMKIWPWFKVWCAITHPKTTQVVFIGMGSLPKFGRRVWTIATYSFWSNFRIILLQNYGWSSRCGMISFLFPADMAWLLFVFQSCVVRSPWKYIIYIYVSWLLSVCVILFPFVILIIISMDSYG